jgi:hypothetical protein
MMRTKLFSFPFNLKCHSLYGKLQWKIGNFFMKIHRLSPWNLIFTFAPGIPYLEKAKCAQLPKTKDLAEKKLMMH